MEGFSVPGLDVEPEDEDDIEDGHDEEQIEEEDGIIQSGNIESSADINIIEELLRQTSRNEMEDVSASQFYGAIENDPLNLDWNAYESDGMEEEYDDEEMETNVDM